jgi:hypothetical protein
VCEKPVWQSWSQRRSSDASAAVLLSFSKGGKSEKFVNIGSFFLRQLQYYEVLTSIVEPVGSQPFYRYRGAYMHSVTRYSRELHTDTSSLVPSVGR